MSKPEIQWVRWVDPLREALESPPEEDEYDPDAFRASAAYPRTRKRRGRVKGPAFVTADAVIPIGEDNVPSRAYNLWVAHSNFVIDRPLAKAFEDTEGVEAINVISPYRMRVAFGRLFDDRVVREAILGAAKSHLKD